LPECAINLAHGVVYLSKSKKDRSAYNAYMRAMKDVQEEILGEKKIRADIKKTEEEKIAKKIASVEQLSTADIGEEFDDTPKGFKAKLKAGIHSVSGTLVGKEKPVIDERMFESSKAKRKGSFKLFSLCYGSRF